LIIGDGPQRQNLEQLSRRLGVQDRVTFTGFRNDQQKYPLLQSSDLFVLVSEHEGFGLVYLEAASQGLPIVAGTVGGQRDFLTHGETGWLVDPNDIPALTHALSSLATQPKLRQHMGQQALTVARRYTIEPVSDAYLKVLYDLLNTA